jgi:periplasmic protein TonB
MKALIISFVTHLAVIAGVLIGSVLAPETMPRMLKRISPPIIASIVAPHDVPLPPPARRSAAHSSSSTAATPTVGVVNAAPAAAPHGVTPESGSEALGSPGTVLGVADGLAGVNNLETFAPPPPPPAPSRPVRLHSGMTAPRKVADVPPNYPEIALRTRVDGVVIIEATIDERGNVIEARVLKSVSLLDAAALAAVRQWKFTPARLNGEAVPVVMTVTVNFQLR